MRIDFYLAPKEQVEQGLAEADSSVHEVCDRWTRADSIQYPQSFLSDLVFALYHTVMGEFFEQIKQRHIHFGIPFSRMKEVLGLGAQLCQSAEDVVRDFGRAVVHAAQEALSRESALVVDAIAA